MTIQPKYNTSNKLSAKMSLPYPAETIFPLLCPVREYDWIPEWQCELIHSECGFNELGCVFQTKFSEETGIETWVTSRFSPPTLVEFVRTTEFLAIHYRIEIDSMANKTELTWSQKIIPLNEKGIALLPEFNSQWFSELISFLESLLLKYLSAQ